ncbi:outer dense fiber protein 2 [Trichogramma pretiosum]|uniref:outer dense fiber protein 2 n=1 Tax=Trichogramma pretiosum TaxID=7493 RepID=UPI000C7194B5|nr:outer dense fiber protein 2 [Trichogramma pretiosum]
MNFHFAMIRHNVTPVFLLFCCLALGVPVGQGHSSTSLVECLPFEDTAVMNEISQFQEEARRLKEEIQNLKAIIQRINQNDCLTKEMTSELSTVQGELAEKLCKMNSITRKLERLMGLVDPGTETFAKMFDMKPFPHDTVTCVDCPKKKKPCDTQSCASACNEDLLQCDKESCDTEPRKGGCDRFIFPEIDYPEDKLPRLIVCGNTEEDFPKIVVADSRPHSRETCPVKKTQESVCQLAKENTELESSKFQLERKLLEKDEELQRLQRKVCSLQAEMRAVQKMNTDLSTTVDCLVKNKPPPPSPCPKAPSCPAAPPSRSPCLPPKKSCAQTPMSGCGQPTQQKSRCCGGGNDMYEALRLHGGASACCGGGGGGCGPQSKSHGRNKGHERGNNIEDHVQNLCEQLSNIECEVRMMQDELTCKQNSQQDQTPCKVNCEDQSCTPAAPKKSARPCPPPPCPKAPQADCCESNLSELKEQYKRLQDDYKSKLCEVSQLRSNTDDLKRNAREAREERDRLEVQLCDALERIRNIEAERDRLLGCNEQMIEQEQALIIARQRFRETQDELEELRTMIRDQAQQLDDYRSKYLHAQQQVEEQRRQLDLMEMDNARMNENVTLEINRVKNQFQEKLAELAPLPEILKQTQIKLQETQQYRLVAEHNCEDLSRDLHATQDTIVDLQNKLNSALEANKELQEEKNDGGGIIEQLEVKNGQLRTENERQKNNVCRLEEQNKTLQKRLDEKTHEVTQLTSMLEQVREDSARQVARTKERCEAIKKSMQGQISDFEVQLAQCRAAAKTAQNERDEIRKKMQGQICNLNDALQQAQGRIRSLQGHVDFLKVSYSNVFGDNDPSDQPGCGQNDQQQQPDCGPTDDPSAGYDTCDCSY